MYTIATLIPAHPNFEQMMLFSAVGFTVVLVVLMFLSLMTSIIGKFFALAAKNAPAAKPAAPKPQVTCSRVFRNCLRCRFRLRRISRTKYRNIRQRTHHGNVLGCLMTHAQ